MKSFQAIILTLAITLICSQDAGKLFDLNKMFEQNTLTAFLASVGEDGYPVTVEDCLDNPTFKPTQRVVDPPNLVKGKSIRIKIGGVMLQDVVLSKLHLDTFYNGKTIYTDDVDKKNLAIKKGRWAYDYEASVPTFTPAGHWEIRLYLVDTDNKNLSCLKATFDTN